MTWLAALLDPLAAHLKSLIKAYPLPFKRGLITALVNTFGNLKPRAATVASASHTLHLLVPVRGSNGQG